LQILKHNSIFYSPSPLIEIRILARDKWKWVWTWFSWFFGNSFSKSVARIMNGEALKIKTASTLISTWPIESWIPCSSWSNSFVFVIQFIFLNTCCSWDGWKEMMKENYLCKGCQSLTGRNRAISKVLYTIM
jgi:hypothetical protein